MYPFTSRSINIYSRIKCKPLQSSTASNNGVIPAQIGRLLCMVLYQTSSVQSSREQNISRYSLFNAVPLWRLRKYKLTTVILEASRNTHFVASCLRKMNWKVDAINDLQALITCNWPHIDLSDSAKLMTVLITIYHWFLSPSYNPYAQSWTCTARNHAFRSHPSKLQGLDPMPQWLVLNLSKCWGKTKPAAVRDMKSQRGWGHSEIVLH